MKQKIIVTSDEVLEEIKSAQFKILALIENTRKDDLTDFITENQAKEILKKKSTWFWQMRKNGQLTFSKIGKGIYYSKSDIMKLFDKN